MLAMHVYELVCMQMLLFITLEYILRNDYMHRSLNEHRLNHMIYFIRSSANVGFFSKISIWVESLSSKYYIVFLRLTIKSVFLLGLFAHCTYTLLLFMKFGEKR